jgi:DNA-binding transcriptional ArsR family regulator
MVQEPSAATEMLKALGDPIRWDIIHQIAAQEELAAATLETTLPVSKPTISYHMKILAQAGLIEVLKRGRNYYYRLHREALDELMDEVRVLMASGPHPVGEPAQNRKPARPARPAEPKSATALRKVVGAEAFRDQDPDQPPTLLTW